VLGVGEFERDYFAGGALFLDRDRALYEYLGNRKLVTIRGVLASLVRPLKTYRSLKSIGERMKAKGVSGNMVGEGLVLGGVLVFDANGDIVFSHPEKTGSPVDPEDVAAALDRLDAVGGAAVTASS